MLEYFQPDFESCSKLLPVKFPSDLENICFPLGESVCTNFQDGNHITCSTSYLVLVIFSPFGLRPPQSSYKSQGPMYHDIKAYLQQVNFSESLFRPIKII